jgi:hypothetical protein
VAAVKVLPNGWRVHRGRTPEERLRNLQRRFTAVRNRYDRAVARRSFYRSARLPLLVAGASFAATFALLALSPFSSMDTIKHIAAFPNCWAARAVGLASAGRGEPGYWSRHDRDGDGIACEPWLR